MPNLKITASAAAAARIGPKLKQIDALMCDSLGAPAVNLLLMRAETGPTSAAVYAELLFMKKPDRDAETIRQLGRDIAALCNLASNESFALRAFAVTTEDLVAVNIAAHG
ncbi:hypothetical protein [Octadecabacter antarcticus]|nr:hypothetical protein [Octadecabacter antarcticus]